MSLGNLKSARSREGPDASYNWLHHARALDGVGSRCRSLMEPIRDVMKSLMDPSRMMKMNEDDGVLVSDVSEVFEVSAVFEVSEERKMLRRAGSEVGWRSLPRDAACGGLTKVARRFALLTLSRHLQSWRCASRSLQSRMASPVARRFALLTLSDIFQVGDALRALSKVGWHLQSLGASRS